MHNSFDIWIYNERGIKMGVIKEMYTNSYFVNVVSGIITVVLIYWFQVSRNKRKIKKDIRCKEIIEETYFFIMNVDEIQVHIKELETSIETTINKEKEDDNNYSKKDENDTRTRLYQEFFKKYKSLYDLTMSALIYENNNILLDSVGTVFFINTNFKVLSIINNIKNRIPNVQKHYENIDSFENEEHYSIQNMNMDLLFLSDYYKALFEYLKVDMLYLKARNNVARIYNESDDTDVLTIINSSLEEGLDYLIDYNRKVKQEYKRLKNESNDKKSIFSRILLKIKTLYVYMRIFIKHIFRIHKNNSTE